jgi:hypothetical protein
MKQKKEIWIFKKYNKWSPKTIFFIKNMQNNIWKKEQKILIANQKCKRTRAKIWYEETIKNEIKILNMIFLGQMFCVLLDGELKPIFSEI